MAIDKRTLVGNIGLAIALTLSGVYQPWLAKYLGHWKIFNWVIFAQMITIFLVPFLLPESCCSNMYEDEPRNEGSAEESSWEGTEKTDRS